MRAAKVTKRKPPKGLGLELARLYRLVQRRASANMRAICPKEAHLAEPELSDFVDVLIREVAALNFRVRRRGL